VHSAAQGQQEVCRRQAGGGRRCVQAAWSSPVCSSELGPRCVLQGGIFVAHTGGGGRGDGGGGGGIRRGGGEGAGDGDGGATMGLRTAAPLVRPLLGRFLREGAGAVGGVERGARGGIRSAAGGRCAVCPAPTQRHHPTPPPYALRPLLAPLFQPLCKQVATTLRRPAFAGGTRRAGQAHRVVPL